MNAEIVPATAEMIKAFYGRLPPQTVKALAVVKDGEVLGLGGYYLVDNGILVFSDIGKCYRGQKKLIVRTMRKVMDMVINAKMRAYAIADPNFPVSGKVLERLGFVEAREGIYVRE